MAGPSRCSSSWSRANRVRACCSSISRHCRNARHQEPRRRRLNPPGPAGRRRARRWARPVRRDAMRPVPDRRGRPPRRSHHLSGLPRRASQSAHPREMPLKRRLKCRVSPSPPLRTCPRAKPRPTWRREARRARRPPSLPRAAVARPPREPRRCRSRAAAAAGHRRPGARKDRAEPVAARQSRPADRRAAHRERNTEATWLR